MKFRWHRGTFAESMAAIVEVANMEELRAELVLGGIAESACLKTGMFSDLPDPRTGWEKTWLVSQQRSDGDWSPIGFTDGEIRFVK